MTERLLNVPHNNSAGMLDTNQLYQPPRTTLPRQEVVYEFPFIDGAATWTPYYCVLADVSEANGAIGAGKDGSDNVLIQSIRMTGNEAVGKNYMIMQKSISPGVDFTDTVIELDYTVEDGSGNADPSLIASCKIYLFEGSDYSYLTLYDDGGVNTIAGRNIARKHINRDEGANPATLDNIDKIRVRFEFTATAKSPSVVVHSLRVFKPLTKSVLLLRVDDGKKSMAPFYHLLHQFGLSCSLGIVTDYADGLNGSTYYTWAELAVLRRWGFGMLNHSEDHGYWSTGSLTVAQQKVGYFNAVKRFYANDMPEGARYWVQPGGTEEYAQATGYSWIDNEVAMRLFTVGLQGNKGDENNSWQNVPWENYLYSDYRKDGNMEAADWSNLSTRVDEAIEDGSILMTCLHNMAQSPTNDLEMYNFISHLRDKVNDGSLIVCLPWDLPNILPGLMGKTVSPQDMTPALADVIPSLTIAGADDADGTGSATIQAKDAAGNNLAQRMLVRTWIADAEYSEPDAQTGFSVATGELMRQIEANADHEVITDATGLAVMDINAGGAKSVYVMAELDGRVYASGEIAITA